MKKFAFLFACLAALALTGCASGPESRAPTEVDMKYVSNVERHARSAGVEVEWVNPPRRARVVEDEG